MYLDAITKSDLEIFESSTGGSSLLQFCDRTNTLGGNKALKRRMESPFSTSEEIIQSQLSIFYIADHRSIFKQLPRGYLVRRIEMYYQEILPVVNKDNFLEFSLEALSIWASNDRHYMRIVQGVQVCRRLIQALKDFLRIPQLKEAPGELEVLLGDLRELIAKPAFHKLPRSKDSLGFLKTLKIDRVFRVHELSTVLRVLDIIFELDALISLAETSVEHKLVKPQVIKGRMQVSAVELVHPFLKNAVANPFILCDSQRGLFLTGPNMAGKTTYMRAFAIALYFAHLGMGVPARDFKFTPVEKFYSSISLSDNLNEGVSYFRAEAMRVKEIAAAIMSASSVVAIMDEPFKGTNVKDTLEASLAILKRFSLKENCLFIFSSHQIELSEYLSGSDYPIDFQYFSAIENETRLRFDYKLHAGVSQQRIGMRVLEEEGVFSLLDGKS